MNSFCANINCDLNRILVEEDCKTIKVAGSADDYLKEYSVSRKVHWESSNGFELRYNMCSRCYDKLQAEQGGW